MTVDRDQIRRDAEDMANTNTPGVIGTLAQDYLALLAELHQAERIIETLEQAERTRKAAEQHRERPAVSSELGRDTSAAAVDGAEQVLGHHEAVGERQGRQPAQDVLDAVAACPTPVYHQTHRYCPSCPWTEEM